MSDQLQLLSQQQMNVLLMPFTASLSFCIFPHILAFNFPSLRAASTLNFRCFNSTYPFVLLNQDLFPCTKVGVAKYFKKN